MANVIEGSETAIAYVGCTQVKVYNNTILFPKKWVVRILQETVNPGRFLPSGNNAFFNNIVIIDNKVSTEVSIGPNTAANTFSFENNIWYKSTNILWQGPNLPGNVLKQLIKDPQIIKGSLYKIDMNSPAVGYGKLHDGVVLDKEGNEYNTPPSVGAYERYHKNN